MGDERLYLVDATAFCYRAYYGLRGLSTSFGQPTNAIFGFVNMLAKILKEKKPRYLAVCFDISRDTFRQKKFAEYKIQRPPMPDGLASQIPLIKEIVSAYGIAILEKENYEADDIIATMAKKAKAQGLAATIISSDKDMLQLVDRDTVVFSPYKDEGVTYDARAVLERFGLEPNKICDIIALMGDDIDNIPGVAGIGEKTAVELLKEFGSLDNLLANIDKVNKEKLKTALTNSRAQIKLNKELAVLDNDVDIEFSPDKLRVGEPNVKELFRLFKILEFKKMLKGLPLEEGLPESIEVQVYSDTQIKELLAGASELFLYGQDCGNIAFFSRDTFFQADKIGANLKAKLSDPKIKKIGHDLKKAKVALGRASVILSGLYFDSMLAAYLLNPSKPEYGLADVAWDYLARPALGPNLDNQSALNLIIKLKPKLESELREKSLEGLLNDLEMPLAEVLADMELNGIKIDLKVLKELSRDIEKRLIKLVEDIFGLSGIQFNINSPKQLREVLFERLKLPVVKKGKTGPSTDEEVLRSLAGRHKLPALLLEYRQLMKLKTTYVDTLPELINPDTGRIHTSFNQTGTETGRLSSSNPNLQNIPVKTDIGARIRQAIVASGEGAYLLSCDYSQIELRILAHLSKDKNLIAAFKEGLDIHKATASLIYGVKEEDVADQMREVAKRVNFGIVYGLTSYGLSRDLGISVDEAQRFIDAYFLTYPQVKDYIEEQIKKARKDGFVTTILARRRYLPEINNKNQGIRQFAERQAVNTPIQGSASDLIKLAMIQIHSQLCQRGLKSKMILQIHDELVFDCPENELGQLVELARDRMENVMSLEVAIRVDIKKGKNWLEIEEVG
jgi:DNA polymerase-1